MKKIFKNPFTYLAIILILIIAFNSYKNYAGKADPDKYDEFAKYLTEQGVKMYGTEWCSHCKNQKKLFGKSFQYINYTDCDKNVIECSAAGITGYPTWSIKGKNYPGEQSIVRLTQLSGYQNDTEISNKSKI